MQKLYVICSSVRPTRIGHDIAQWVMNALPAESGIELELINLADWPLPMDDEPGVPARDLYVHAHTRAWSEKISQAAGYIFVTPQYNWGYPAALKNALDHLYKEWAGKPAMIVSYGFHGGDKCAAQLRVVLQGLHMRTVATMPALTLPRAMEQPGAQLDLAADSFAPVLVAARQGFAEMLTLLKAGNDPRPG
jgi:NAD(P)H-dependent FMN reductase